MSRLVNVAPYPLTDALVSGAGLRRDQVPQMTNNICGWSLKAAHLTRQEREADLYDPIASLSMRTTWAANSSTGMSFPLP